MQVTKEKPRMCRITVQDEATDPTPTQEGGEVRFAPGTVAEVMAELFGEKPEKIRKARQKRRTRVEIEAAQRMLRSNKPPLEFPEPGPQEESVNQTASGVPVEKPRRRKKAEPVWP